MFSWRIKGFFFCSFLTIRNKSNQNKYLPTEMAWIKKKCVSRIPVGLKITIWKHNKLEQKNGLEKSFLTTQNGKRGLQVKIWKKRSFFLLQSLDVSLKSFWECKNMFMSINHWYLYRDGEWLGCKILVFVITLSLSPEMKTCQIWLRCGWLVLKCFGYIFLIRHQRCMSS